MKRLLHGAVILLVRAVERQVNSDDNQGVFQEILASARTTVTDLISDIASRQVERAKSQ